MGNSETPSGGQRLTSASTGPLCSAGRSTNRPVMQGVKNNLGVRKMRRRKSTFNDFFDLLFEVSGDFWQFGATVTVALGVFSLLALKWAVGKSAAASAATGTSLAVFQNLSWAFYLVPIMLAIFTVIFGWKAFTAYAKQNNF